MRLRVEAAEFLCSGMEGAESRVGRVLSEEVGGWVTTEERNRTPESFGHTQWR